MKALTISELVAARISAKRAEDEAIAERRGLDAQLAEMLKDPNKPEGSISQKLEGLGVKLTVTYKINRSVDGKKLQADWDKLTAGAQAAFKWKPDVSVSELRKLEGPDATVAAIYITAKPGAPSVEIDLI
jgi:hypothetical protein